MGNLVEYKNMIQMCTNVVYDHKAPDVVKVVLERDVPSNFVGASPKGLFF